MLISSSLPGGADKQIPASRSCSFKSNHKLYSDELIATSPAFQEDTRTVIRTTIPYNIDEVADRNIYLGSWLNAFSIVMKAGPSKGNNTIRKEEGRITNKITKNDRIDDLTQIKSIKPTACQSAAAMRVSTAPE
jgi:hypothetical protein